VLLLTPPPGSTTRRMASGQSTISVHRCRFVDTKPSPITALAFPPLPLPSNKSEKPETFRRPLEYGTLAIGHANGNIDLYEWTGSRPQQPAPQAWVICKVCAPIVPFIPTLNASPSDIAWTSKLSGGLFIICHPISRRFERGRCPFALSASSF
jgi:hypothetical protein